jgi:hypothetical protein
LWETTYVIGNAIEPHGEYCGVGIGQLGNRSSTYVAGR